MVSQFKLLGPTRITWRSLTVASPKKFLPWAQYKAPAYLAAFAARLANMHDDVQQHHAAPMKMKSMFQKKNTENNVLNAALFWS